MEQLLNTLSNLFSIFFVVGSMLALGFGLHLRQIIAPLKRWSLVWRVLLVNFLLVPGFAYLVSEILTLKPGYEIGLVLIGMCAGAPFIPKLIQLAHGDIATSVGVMALLMVTTVFYVPVMIPLLLQNVEVDPMAIAGNLILMMLLPLSIALAIHARYEKLAESWQPLFSQIANIGLGGLIITMILINGSLLLSILSSALPWAVIIFIVGSFLIGSAFASPRTRGGHALFGFSAAQRNIAAGMVVASQSFADNPDVIVVIIVMAVSLNVILLLGASEWGKQTLKRQGGSGDNASAEANA